jgi:hypothetical protein
MCHTFTKSLRMIPDKLRVEFVCKLLPEIYSHRSAGQ